jgi:hypothetical protein
MGLLTKVSTPRVSCNNVHPPVLISSIAKRVARRRNDVWPHTHGGDVATQSDRCARERGGWTAEELDAALQRGDTLVSRARF